MPIISFVNRDIRETGQSLSAAAVALNTIIELVQYLLILIIKL